MRLGAVRQEADLVEGRETTTARSLILGLGAVAGDDKSFEIDKNFGQVTQEDLPEGIIELQQLSVTRQFLGAQKKLNRK